MISKNNNSKLNNFKFLLGKSNFNKMILLFFILIFSSLVEMIGLGSIPVLAMAFIDSEKFLTYIPENLQFGYILDLDKKSLLFLMSIIVVSIFVIKNILLSIFMYFQFSTVKKIKIYLSESLMKKYLMFNYSFFLKRNPSLIIRALSVDVGNTTIYIMSHINLMKEVLILIGVFILLLSFDATISFSIFMLLLLVVSVYYFLTKKSLLKRAKIIQKIHSEVYKSLTQAINAIKDIKLFRAEKFFHSSYMKLVKENEDKVLKNNFIFALPRLFLEVVTVFTILSICTFFVFLGRDTYQIIPYVSLFVVCSVRLIPTFNVISNSLSSIKSLTPNFNYLCEEFSFKNPINNAFTFEDNLFSNFNFKKNIKINNIDFIYPSTTKKIFENFTLEIKCGSKFGIIGESGSGKTTLVNLITGLLDPNKGNIQIDENNLDSIKNNWQNSLGYVHQETYILNQTIRENIAFGVSQKEIIEKNVITAIKKSQLENYISNLDNKIDTVMDDNGKNLSGGQKQRLGIARALFKNPQVIILDEATSSLDLETEKKFIDEVFENSTDKTIIIISHRLSALEKCEIIFDLKNKKFLKN